MGQHCDTSSLAKYSDFRLLQSCTDRDKHPRERLVTAVTKYITPENASAQNCQACVKVCRASKLPVSLPTAIKPVVSNKFLQGEAKQTRLAHIVATMSNSELSIFPMCRRRKSGIVGRRGCSMVRRLVTHRSNF